MMRLPVPIGFAWIFFSSIAANVLHSLAIMSLGSTRSDRNETNAIELLRQGEPELDPPLLRQPAPDDQIRLANVLAQRIV